MVIVLGRAHAPWAWEPDFCVVCDASAQHADRLEELRSENNTLRSDAEMLRKQNTILRSGNEDLRSGNENLRSANATLRSNHEALRSENQHLRSESEALRSANESLRSENKSLRLAAEERESVPPPPSVDVSLVEEEARHLSEGMSEGVAGE
jgi:FtsZ-binding cell division protein ZapB